MGLPVLAPAGALMLKAGGALAGGSALVGTGIALDAFFDFVFSKVRDTGLQSINQATSGEGARGAPRGTRVRSSRPQWSSDQLASMSIIVSETEAAALPHSLASSRPALVIAMVANAWAESLLNPKASNISSREASYGLFQINVMGALGRPHAPESLLHARYNARVILSEVWRQRAPLVAVVDSGGTVADLVAAFCEHVERPASARQEGSRRAKIAVGWFGHRMSERAYRWSP